MASWGNGGVKEGAPTFRRSAATKAHKKGSSFSVSQNDPRGADGTRAAFSRDRGVFVLPSVVNGEQRNTGCDRHEAL